MNSAREAMAVIADDLGGGLVTVGFGSLPCGRRTCAGRVNLIGRRVTAAAGRARARTEAGTTAARRHRREWGGIVSSEGLDGGRCRFGSVAGGMNRAAKSWAPDLFYLY